MITAELGRMEQIFKEELSLFEKSRDLNEATYRRIRLVSASFCSRHTLDPVVAFRFFSKCKREYQSSDNPDDNLLLYLLLSSSVCSQSLILQKNKIKRGGKVVVPLPPCDSLLNELQIMGKEATDFLHLYVRLPEHPSAASFIAEEVIKEKWILLHSLMRFVSSVLFSNVSFAKGTRSPALQQVIEIVSLFIEKQESRVDTNTRTPLERQEAVRLCFVQKLVQFTLKITDFDPKSGDIVFHSQSPGKESVLDFQRKVLEFVFSFLCEPACELLRQQTESSLISSSSVIRTIKLYFSALLLRYEIEREARTNKDTINRVIPPSTQGMVSLVECFIVSPELVVDLFGENDVLLFYVLRCFQRLHGVVRFRAYEVEGRSGEEETAIRTFLKKFTAIDVFCAMCKEFGYDEMVLLEFLLSAEESVLFLSFLIHLLKDLQWMIANEELDGAREGERFERGLILAFPADKESFLQMLMTLERLLNLLARTFSKNLLPFNPTALLKKQEVIGRIIGSIQAQLKQLVAQ